MLVVRHYSPHRLPERHAICNVFLAVASRRIRVSGGQNAGKRMKILK
jgi:hypothetical protein